MSADNEYFKIIGREPPVECSTVIPEFEGKMMIPWTINGRKYEVPKIIIDRSLQEAYDSTINSRLDDTGYVHYPFLKARQGMVHLGRQLVGRSYRINTTIAMVPCRKTFRELLDLATNNMSEETSNSSPSIILHQICSFSILFSLPSDYRVVFEDSSVAGTPDLKVTGPDDDFYIEISTSAQFANKSDKYDGPLIVLNKYELIKSFSENDYLSFLTSLSSSIDSKDQKMASEIINRQNIKQRELLYNDEIAHFLQNAEEQDLDVLSSMANDEIFSSLKEDHVDSEHFSLDFSDFIALNLFDWLNFDFLPCGESPLRAFPTDFEVVNDELRVESETEASSAFFTKVERIQMDSRALNKATSYRTGHEWRVASNMDLYYTQRILPELNSRASKYYSTGYSSKLTLKDGLFAVRDKKQLEGISHIDDSVPEYSTSSSIKESLTNKADLPVDPIDLEILRNSGQSLLDWLKRSKIYHLLRLMAKAAQSILSSARDISGRRFTVKAEWSVLSIDMLVCGNPVEQDKGVIYVSLIDQGRLVKTWLWRSVDLKHYVRASTALVSCCAGMFSECSGRKQAALDVYSLLIFENSWGASKVLKVYRYMSMGFLYKSPLLYRQVLKLRKTIEENSSMVRRKMSLSLLFSLLRTPAEGTPAFGFDEATLGYEIFLVNLCPSDTYGSRKHRVDVTKEFMEEIELWENRKSSTINSFMSFNFLIENAKDRDWDACRHIMSVMSKELNELSIRNKGRFTLSPLSLLSVWSVIKKLRVKFTGTVPKINELMTMKASFDPLEISKCSALEAISRISLKENQTNTSSLAISILSRVMDLTFRMFDKAQVGGNREISILSSEYRILQSILENFSKRLGAATGIDMLDNPLKVELLSRAHNACNGGIRLTADQTRWGPNFNTSLFGYMYCLFSRRTTEAFVPMITCFLGELKIFEAMGYSELWKYQKDGYTLPGMFGQSHMGQGIYHYTSSLWHSLVHKVWSDRIERVYSKASLRVTSFCTSDDIAQFFITKEKEGEVLDSKTKNKIRERSLSFLRKYPSFLQFYSILTSDYKNMISDASIEFNSFFLNSASVGSNSIKFLFSLIEPYTSGNKLRDLNNIWDTFSDGLNSGLSTDTSTVLALCTMKMRLLQWAERSESILGLIHLFRQRQAARDNKYELPLMLSGKCIGISEEDVPECPTVLPFRKYADYVRGLDDYTQMLREETAMAKMELKKETLSKAKARRLSSNRGLVLSKKLRSMSKILLPYDNSIGAVSITSAAYLSYVISNSGASGLYSPSRAYQQRPYTVRREAKAGISVVTLRSSRLSRADLDQLVVSSYERVGRLNPESTQIQIYLHLCRKKANLRMKLTKELSEMSFHQRIRHFDNVISQSRIVGNAKRLEYNPSPKEYESYQFEDVSGVVSFFPVRNLLMSEVNLLGLESDFPKIYSMRFGKVQMMDQQFGRRTVVPYYEREFNITMEDILMSARKLLETEPGFAMSSGRSPIMYMNITAYQREYQRDNEVVYDIINPDVDEDMGSYILRIMEAAGMGFEDSFESFDSNSKDEGDILPKDSFKVKTNIISIPIKQHVSILAEPWFLQESINNAILGRMISDGFVQMQTQGDPFLAWSYWMSHRHNLTNRISIKSKSGELREYSYSLYLNSLFDIRRVVSEIARDVYLPMSSSAQLRALRMLSCSRNSENLGFDAIGPLPIGITISSEPKGRLVDPNRIESIDDIKEYVAFAPSKSFSSPEKKKVFSLY